MITIKHKSQCSGCSACADLCPKDCITMKPDNEGFFYASADATNCIECGLCERVCPIIDDAQRYEPQKAYAAWSKTDSVHTSSTSGGAAYEIGRLVLGKGGVVYGCSGTDPFNVQHIRIEHLPDLAAMQGSKYVQSNTAEIYRQLRKDVLSGRQVLFTGTPCQGAAVRKMFRKTPDNLLIVDIICHGVPSQHMLNKQLDAIKRDNGLDNISSVSFRQSNSDKYCFVIGGYKHNQFKELKLQGVKTPYFKSFIYGLNFRESCYQCPYAGSKRVSDMTIGDFWGFKAADKLPFEPKKGLSVLLPNTPKGEKLMEELTATMETVERPVAEAIEGNTQLRHPMKKGARVKLFRLLNGILPENVTSKIIFTDQKMKTFLR